MSDGMIDENTVYRPLSEAEWNLNQLVYKAHRIGQYKGVTTTCKEIPRELYDQIRAAWAEVKKTNPDYVIMR